jgi:hypothetical protein
LVVDAHYGFDEFGELELADCYGIILFCVQSWCELNGKKTDETTDPEIFKLLHVYLVFDYEVGTR